MHAGMNQQEIRPSISTDSKKDKLYRRCISFNSTWFLLLSVCLSVGSNITTTNKKTACVCVCVRNEKT